VRRRQVYWSPEVSGSIAKACGVAGLTENEYRSRVLQPFNGAKVFLANNDWVAQVSRADLLDANRANTDFGGEMISRGRFATPAQCI
jgi:hypothetical protein